MVATLIELTEAESVLAARIDFHPSRHTHNADSWHPIAEAMYALTKSLLSRDAIPEARKKFFTDPAFNIGGHGRSRLQVFEKNGTKGDAIFRHPHFLKYLHYFIYGPDLPTAVLDAFQRKVDACGFITSGDIVPLGDFARQQVRSHGLKPASAADEFFKLALDCGLDISDARSIRDSVKGIR
jgi:hypothetical protein